MGTERVWVDVCVFKNRWWYDIIVWVQDGYVMGEWWYG